VRFNRHAVYLGDPPADQRCPAAAVGRTEAVLIEGLRSRGAVLPMDGAVARLVMRRAGVVVTATWGHDRKLVERILRRRLKGSAPAAVPAVAGPTARTARAAVAGATYTGLGFDPCSAPSDAQMLAWAASPYRAIGIYIGGADMACGQTNLTAAWVQTQLAAGWNFIPTYVGLQAPTNSCGCTAIQPKNAAAEGTAAANDAVAQAQAIGLGARSPIYYDMEAYPLTMANTTAVNTFLSAWTTQLHVAGYVSGVYSSADSGISDLVAQQATTFVEPDDLWIASWNGQPSTADPNVPSTEWANHQRIHQYEGGHDETYGNVTLNIDNDYLDGPVAGAGTITPVTPAPTPGLSVSPGPDGSIAVRAAWPGEPGIAAWQLLAGNSPTALTPFGAQSSGGASRLIKVHSQFAYFAVEALGSTGLPIGSSSAAPTPPHIAIYGHSAFVPEHGSTGGVPIGCFVPTGCSIATTVSVGKTVIAQTAAESVAAGTGAVAFFKLSKAGRTMLAKAPSRRLAVQISANDTSGATGGTGIGPGAATTVPPASVGLNLVPFKISGTSPVRALRPSPMLRLLAATAFVYADSAGGILADCVSQAPCSPTVTITHGSTTIAQTPPEQLGAQELGYLQFKLTPQGRSLLAARAGNQLGARIRLTQIVNGATTSATGRIALVGYH
jgi:hypothetical protein